MNQILEMLECNPVIAAIKDDKWQSALKSPVKVIFYTSANLLTIRQKVAQAHQANKYVMVHLDLAEGTFCARNNMYKVEANVYYILPILSPTA